MDFTEPLYVGQNMEYWRIYRGYTPRQLALRAETTEPTITRIKRGTGGYPSIPMLRGIAQALDLSFYQLFVPSALDIETPHDDLMAGLMRSAHQMDRAVLQALVTLAHAYVVASDERGEYCHHY